MRTAYRGEFTKEYVLLISKTINSIGCWIPQNKAKSNGYVQVSIDGKLLMLHRVVLSLWHNIDYYNQLIETMHNPNCDRRCFNPEHVRPGSHNENMKENKHHNSEKLVCPKCGGPYTIIVCRTGANIGKTMRRCRRCRRS